ncbi:MAG: HAD-IIA family hydrolase [Chloroflexi bacterium]|nr:HAD-IIA family hydrolase [Chloroflexota bacterium]
MPAPRDYLIDMDGVLISGGGMIPGADGFLARLRQRAAKHLILTNNSRYTPGDLAHRLRGLGLEVPAECIFTSAMATARFLQAQRPNGTAFVIGESGLTWALYNVGYVITDRQPDYVVLGEAASYTLESFTQAVRLIGAGARFIATNPDPNGPGEGGIVPACGAVAALIEKASGVSPLFVGKPNPLMMRMALNYLGAHSENTTMIGDRMDTDVIAGVQSGMETILVLSGVTRRDDVARFPYQPTHIAESVAEIEP